MTNSNLPSFAELEINDMFAELPPFGSERQRWLTTVLKLQTTIDDLRLQLLRATRPVGP